MKVVYAGRGLGILMARRILRVLHEGGRGCLPVSRAMMNVEALPRLVLYHGFKGLSVKGVDPHNILDTLGNSTPVNTEAPNLYRHIGNWMLRCDGSVRTCIERECELITRNTLTAMGKLGLASAGGAGVLLRNPAPGEAIVEGYGPRGSLRLRDGTGWEAYVLKARPYTLMPLGPPARDLTLRAWDGSTKRLTDGLQLSMCDGDLMFRKGRLWWRVSFEDRPDQMWVGGGYARFVSDAYSITHLDRGGLVLEGEGEILVEPWNASGTLGCIVDLSRYTVECGRISDVLYAYYGVDGVGGVALGPLFGSTLRVEEGKLVVKIYRGSRIRMLLYTGGYWHSRIVGNIFCELLAPKVVDYTPKGRPRPAIRVYPESVVPLYLEFKSGMLRVLLWNLAPYPQTAKVEASKPIYGAILEGAGDDHRLRVFERVTLVPVGAMGVVWLQLRYTL